jgi:hypothetical protein
MLTIHCYTFFTAKYTSEKGIQGFYDTLLDHAHNMAVYPDDYLVVETFLKGIPEFLHKPIITNGLHLKSTQLTTSWPRPNGMSTQRKPLIITIG